MNSLKKIEMCLIGILVIIFIVLVRLPKTSGDKEAQRAEEVQQDEAQKEKRRIVLPIHLEGEEIEVEEKTQWEKGYDLPYDEEEKEQAEQEMKEVLGIVDSVLYNQETEDESGRISARLLEKVAEELAKENYMVRTDDVYSNLENSKNMEQFLNSCLAGQPGNAILYKVTIEGIICRDKYIFDGSTMYVYSMSVMWNGINDYFTNYCSYSRIKNWRYSENGWFGYEVCVPEFPEVMEMVDGSTLIRVKPITEENRQASEKYVRKIGYQGNNLLCSDWDSKHIENLDLNGLYDAFYLMEYGSRYETVKEDTGISQKSFETLIQKHLQFPVSEIRRIGKFDEKKKEYPWARLGCFNYNPNYFGTAIPEVIKIRNNEDGTMTLTVNAVCESMVYDDAVITHELTIRIDENGEVCYLSNHVLGDGLCNIPAYQYRLPRE